MGGWPACRSARRRPAPAGLDRAAPGLVADADEEVVHPILRHQDLSLYFRQRETDRYAWELPARADAVRGRRPPRVPGRRAAAERRAVHARGLRGRVRESIRLLPGSEGPDGPLDRDRRDVLVHARHGLDRRRVRGRPRFWMREAVWVTHRCRMGRMAAEWIAGGDPSMDMGEADANRFYPFMTTARMRAGARRAAVPRGLRHHPSLQQMSHPRGAEARPSTRASRGARRRVLLGRRLGAAAVVRGEPQLLAGAVGVADRVGGEELVAVRGRGGTSRRASASRCSTSRRSRSSTSPAPMRSRSSSASAPTGSSSRRDDRLHLDAHAVRRDGATSR